MIATSFGNSKSVLELTAANVDIEVKDNIVSGDRLHYGDSLHSNVIGLRINGHA